MIEEGRPLPPGQVIDDRYRIDRVIGHGGMGIVYLAEHLLIHRKVALKVLHAELVDDEGTVERFFAEARTVGRLGHPHIVESTDMGFLDGRRPYIVFEYLEGFSLNDAIYAPGMTVPRALHLAEQIASGLAAAHAAGIVHRDLKAENIFLVQRDGMEFAKILDFGVSLLIEGGSVQRTTRRGIIMGTPEYLSPEQIETPDDVDHRADLYALGVILYEAMARKRPFEGSARTLLHRIVHEAPPPLTHVQNEVAALVEKLMAKKREHRYASAADAEAAIARLADAHEAHEDTPAPVLLATGQAAIVHRRRNSSNRSQPYARSVGRASTDPGVGPRAGTPWPVVAPAVTASPAPTPRPFSRWGLGLAVTGALLAVGTGAMMRRGRPRSSTVTLEVTSDLAGATLLFRGQHHALPITLDVAAGNVPEYAEITVNGHAPLTRWVTATTRITWDAHFGTAEKTSDTK